jgi:hydroxymethylglutaryl-CoA reductase
LNLSDRHELLAEATGLDRVILNTLRPEYGLSLQQISAVVLASGNDTRAVEAGAHSHAVDRMGATGG